MGLRWHHSCALLPKDLGLCEMRDHIPVQLLWVAGRRRPQPWRHLEHPSRMASELILSIAPCWLLLLLAPQSALLQRFWALRGLHDDSRTRLALLKLSCACIAEVLSNSASREGRVQAGLVYIHRLVQNDEPNRVSFAVAPICKAKLWIRKS